MTVSLNNMLSQVIPLLAAMSSDSYFNSPVPTMATTLSTQINQSVVLSSISTNLASDAKAGTIKAQVISASPLLQPKGEQPSSGQYKILLAHGRQQFEIIAKSLLPPGSQLELKISENQQTAILLKILPDSHSSQPSKPPIATANTLHSPVTHNSATKTSATAASTPLLNNKPVEPLNPEKQSIQQIIESGIRQSLPKQQPTSQLVNLLQNVLNNRLLEQKHAPEIKQLTSQINQLIKLFPTSSQMQNVQPVRQAIENSGLFLETKLARIALSTRSEGDTGADRTRNPTVQTDIKAAVQHLYKLLTPSISQTGPAANPHSVDFDSTENLTPFTYTAKPVNSTSNTVDQKANKEQNLDIVLRQIGLQLLASIARTQFNQLESLGSRQSNSPDNTGPNNSWVTEIPIIHGKYVDNLAVRIDQHSPNQNANDENRHKLWTVMLAFDLHSLGKMNVQLKIIEHTVSAMVWSSQEKTHHQVQKNINILSDNLNKAGVNVTQMECRLGEPPENKIPLLKQLVDVRT